jgi:hypothetical protein
MGQNPSRRRLQEGWGALCEQRVVAELVDHGRYMRAFIPQGPASIQSGSAYSTCRVQIQLGEQAAPREDSLRRCGAFFECMTQR